MKQLMVLGVVLFSWVSTAVMADCSSNQVTGSALTDLIPGKTVCASFNGDKWQEEHRSGSQLWDYKKGPSDAVDPSEQVGTWGITSDIVTYTYGSTSYGYTVYDEGSGASYTFCGVSGGAPVISGATLGGAGSCP
jgi:hypothetical protein